MLKIVSDNDDEQPLSPDEVNQLFNDNRRTMRENMVNGYTMGGSVRNFLIGIPHGPTHLRLLEQELDESIQQLIEVRNIVGKINQEIRRTRDA